MAKCELCGKENIKTLYAFANIEMCEECFKTLISLLQYKNCDDMTPEDKKLLMKFCNKFVNQYFNKDNE